MLSTVSPFRQVEIFWRVEVRIYYQRAVNLIIFAGTNEIRIWDLMTMKKIPASHHHARERTHTSSLRWINHSSDLGLDLETLCYSNVLGYFVFLQRSKIAAHSDPDHRLGKGPNIYCFPTVLCMVYS